MASPASSSEGTADVERFLATLDHPLREAVLALREIILAADDAITEGIKWNVPSFFRREWFATFHLRARDKVQLVLHTGAKTKAGGPVPFEIEDPLGLLEWRGADRCLLTFRSPDEVQSRGQALTAILVQWIAEIDRSSDASSSVGGPSGM